jgi:hypothetical protein
VTISFAIGTVLLAAIVAASGAAISPGEVLVPTIVVGVLALVFVVRSLIVRHELGEHGNQTMLRSVNRLRERRGF